MSEYLNERTYEANFETCLDNSPLVDLQQTYYTTPQEENKRGYDAMFDLNRPGIPIFIQFKIPDEVSPQKAREIANHFGAGALNLGLSMPLNPDFGFRQHRKLRRNDRKRRPCLTLYSTPKYSTQNEHRRAYESRSVHQQSVYFLPKEIGKVKSVNSCKIGYFTGSNNAALYSHKERAIVKTKSVKAYTFLDVIGLAVKKLQMHNYSLQENIDEVYNDKIGKNVSVTKKVFRFPSGPSEGTLGFMVTHEEYENINRNQQGYYAAKIDMLARMTHDKMGTRLFLFQYVGGQSFLFQSVEAVPR